MCTSPVKQPGKILGYTQKSDSVEVEFTNAQLEVSFLENNLLRLTWQPGTLPAPYAIAAVDWPSVSLNVIENKAGLDIFTPELKVRLQATGALHFLDSNGQTLRTEMPPEYYPTVGEFPHQQQIRWTSRAGFIRP